VKGEQRINIDISIRKKNGIIIKPAFFSRTITLRELGSPGKGRSQNHEVFNVMMVKYHFFFCYIHVDYVSGGELFTHLYQREKFSEDEVRIYIAEIILALEHLHKVRNIQHLFSFLERKCPVRYIFIYNGNCIFLLNILFDYYLYL